MLDHHQDTNGSLALGFGKTHHRHLLCRLEERFSLAETAMQTTVLSSAKAPGRALSTIR